MSRGTLYVYTPGLRLNSVCVALSLAICTLLDGGAPEASSASFLKHFTTKIRGNRMEVWCFWLPPVVPCHYLFLNTLAYTEKNDTLD